ncbi:MAG TPA: ATP-dependent DNA ligase, partial [Hyphomicrobium sp.]|nr:ATP-dependent DNA ligase [Hyphomicrobium sp.]
MRAFARLLDCLAYTQSRNRKLALLGHYFRSAPDPDRGWALAALTDGVPIRMPLRRMLNDLVGRFIDPVLYRLSRDYVGDTAETVSLLWPDHPVELAPPSALASTAMSRVRGGDAGEKSKQLSLDFTPTPTLSPQGGGELRGAHLLHRKELGASSLV